MRLPASFLVTTLLAIPMLCDVAKADVGQCYVMCICGIDGQLNAEQQREVGRRIMKAHEASGQSDSHIVFICLISRNRDDKGVLYRISETAVGAGDYPMGGYWITAPDFNGVRHAVAEVEMAFKQSRIHQLRPGARDEAVDVPIYKE